jgi:hypothetical protein
LRIRILSVAWMSLSCEWRVLSGRGHCDGPIIHPGESCRVCVCCWVWSQTTVTLYTYNEYMESNQTKKDRKCFIPPSYYW